MSLVEADSKLPVVANWRSMSAPDRLKSIKGIFLYHPELRSLLERLEHIFHSPPGIGVLMHGVPKVGIGSLIKRFADTHPLQPRKPVALHPVILTTPTSKLTAA